MTESFSVQQAGELERARAADLRRIALFAELNLDADEIARSTELFAQMIRRYHRARGPEWIIGRFPALTLTTLIGHAGLYYDRNRYWDSFWAELGLARDIDFEKLLREVLRDLLRTFGMREFPELEHQYVQVMAVHAGIPVHCLGDLVDVIDQHITAGRTATGAALFEWLTAPGMAYRLDPLDVPVRNFLRLGGEVAVDIVDRIIEFAEYFAEHPEAANDLTLDTATTGLPNLLLDALIDRLDGRPLGSGPLEPAAVARTRQPLVAYSPLDQRIVVEVPYPQAAPESPWRVLFDGAPQTVYAERAWGSSGDGAQPATPVPVPRPVRQIVLGHESLAGMVRLPLVDKNDPLLLFDESGRALSRHAALPRGMVVAVCPHDASVIDADAGVPLEPIDELVPVGWQDWRARTYDLSGPAAIRWRRGPRTGPLRQVRASAAARFGFGAPLPGVSTRSGLSVYAERPTVELPPAGVPTRWRVRTRRAGTVDWLTDDEWEADAEETELDPFDGVAPGLLGLFDVVVSGPLGSDLRHSVFLAEGLAVRYSTEFRVPDGDGLAPSSCALTARSPLTVDAQRLEFGRAVRDLEIRVGSGDRSERLLVRPPHIELRVDSAGTVAQWRSTAATLTTDQLAEHATIAVRVPGEVEVDIVLTDQAGAVRQIEVPNVAAGNVFRVPTRTFLDTARSLGVSALLARIDAADGRTRAVPLARIRPPALCTGVGVAAGALLFDGVSGSDLAALVWADTAPWREPDQLVLDGPRAVLPPELLDAGPLTVQVYVDDPWSVTVVPEQPGDDALRIDRPGWFTDPDPARTALSRFLAGLGPAPADGAVLPEVWAALAGATATRPMRAVMHELLRRDPRSALEALADTAIPPSGHPALLISAGLAEADFASVVRTTLPADPWLGCLLDIADLPVLARDRGSAGYRDLIGRLAEAGGERLPRMLAGDAGNPGEGVFDLSAVRMHRMDPAAIRELKSACEIVPAALLDTDTRTSAMFEAFEQRLAWQDDPASGRLSGGSRPLLAAVRRASRAVYDQIAARNEVLDGVDTAELPWMLMSMQSLLLAVVARSAARGSRVAPITPALRADWARLARLCPALVSTDLLIADALTTHDRHPDVIGEPT
ncbi:hypothetical protein [Nocardia jiangsuensis]|uniref:Uncharacterized protein n=1 Tax=Nocardia jiangsuensis TaxID=1691563 RepID=A0ABV8E031_9NOCA